MLELLALQDLFSSWEGIQVCSPLIAALAWHMLRIQEVSQHSALFTRWRYAWPYPFWFLCSGNGLASRNLGNSTLFHNRLSCPSIFVWNLKKYVSQCSCSFRKYFFEHCYFCSLGKRKLTHDNMVSGIILLLMNETTGLVKWFLHALRRFLWRFQFSNVTHPSLRIQRSILL